MNVKSLNASVTPEAACVALRDYKQHRDTYDARDWEIERIYRAISKGKTVISVVDAIHRAGLDGQGRPKLAVCRADRPSVFCERSTDEVWFGPRWPRTARIVVPWPGMTWLGGRIESQLPRIPPQHRPAQNTLKNYHILWEADWTAIPRDPYLLRRIGKDAWVVLAAWDLTDVEISVLRAHQERV